MELFELYFEDLKESAQQRLLEVYGEDAPNKYNWDITPVTEWWVEPETEDDNDSEEWEE